MIRNKQSRLDRVMARALLLGSAGALLYSAPATAQQGPASATAEEERAPGEIVVTAQKRAENLQDVPISIAVVGADTLEAFNINEATDLQYFVPGVQVLNAAGPRSFGFYIRGIGTTSFSSESVEGSVAYVVDGVVMGQSGASLSDLPDIERIEVLRGPQGTLFGKNASAGVINVVTKRPSDKWEGRIAGSWAWPLDERKASAYISGPVSDDVRILVSARVNKRDGLVRNLFDGRDLNDRNDYGFRGKIEATPGSNFTSTLTADWWRRRSDCCIWTLRSITTPPNAIEASQIAAGIVPSPTNRLQNINGDLRSDVDSWGVSLTNELETDGGFVVSSISAFRSWHTIDGLDTDSTPLNIYDLNYADFRQRQFSQELRLTSPKGGFVDYVVGLFYFHSGVTSVSFQDYLLNPAAFAGRRVTNDATTDNYAVFGQANVNISDRFRLIAGVRWLSETAFASKLRVDTRSNATQFNRAKKTDSGFVWRLGAQYDVTDDANVFATVTRGFKAGGFDTGIGFADLFNVNPEKPTSFEAGVRTSWPEAGITANLTAYHVIVEDYQISARAPGVGSIFYLTNAAKLRSTGVEADVSWRPRGPTDFTLTASGSYNDAVFKDFPNAQCYPGQTAALGCVGGQQDLSGEPLPHAPKFSANLQASYADALADGPVKMKFDADLNYRSKTIQGFPAFGPLIQKRYALLNASITLMSRDDRWNLQLFGRNLTDKNFATTITGTVLGSAGNTQQYPLYEARRVIGIGAGFQF